MPQITHGGEAATQLHAGAFADDEGGEALDEYLHDVLHGHGLGVGGSFLRRQEGALHHRLVVEHLLEVLVLTHDALVIFVLEPVAAALSQLLYELAVEQVVADIARIVDLVSIGADKAARARGIGKRAQVVGCSNERGEAPSLFHSLAVGWAELYVLF